MAICKHCGNEFQAKRKTAQFCSDRCRVRQHRWKDNSVATPKINALDAIHHIGKMVEGEFSYEAVLALKTIAKIATWQACTDAGSWWRCQKCWQAVRKEIPLDGDCSCGKCEDADWRLQKKMF